MDKVGISSFNEDLVEDYGVETINKKNTTKENNDISNNIIKQLKKQHKNINDKEDEQNLNEDEKFASFLKDIKDLKKGAKNISKEIDLFVNLLREIATKNKDNYIYISRLETLRKICIDFLRRVQSNIPKNHMYQYGENNDG